MNSKLSSMVIVGLLGIIGYQSGFLDKYFSNNSIDCDSQEAINLGKEIIKDKQFPRLFNNIKYNIEDIEFNTIITKKINKDTGAQECSATTNILADFQINKESKKEYKFFNLLLGSDKVVNLGDNKFLISSSIFYTTEVTSDRKQYMINLKFDGDRTSLYTDDIPTSDEDTFKLVFPFAKKGNANLQNQIGVMYSKGKGVEKNISEAIKWYEKSANQNNPWGLYNLANLYYVGNSVDKDYKKAFEFFTKSAELGNYDAQNRLANMYYAGEGVQKDYKQAIYWYEKSANQGYDWAQYNLADIYYKGIGIEKDYQKAFSFYTLAANQGHTKSQYNLGSMYYNGKGIERNHKKGFDYYNIAANKGNADAQFSLGFLYYKGEYVNKDYQKAVNYFVLAAKQGDVLAQYYLGDMYYNGKGIDKDYENAFKYYTLAANQNDTLSQFFLGHMYANGEGVKQNYNEAKKWFKKTCDDKLPDGCNLYKKLTEAGY